MSNEIDCAYKRGDQCTKGLTGTKCEPIGCVAHITVAHKKAVDEAMKHLDMKIAQVSQRGTWKGVDVDKYMAEVRGYEPECGIEAMKANQRELIVSPARGHSNQARSIYRKGFYIGYNTAKKEILELIMARNAELNELIKRIEDGTI